MLQAVGMNPYPFTHVRYQRKIAGVNMKRYIRSNSLSGVCGLVALFIGDLSIRNFPPGGMIPEVQIPPAVPLSSSLPLLPTFLLIN